MLRLSNFPKKDHALASYSAIILFVSTLITQVLPQVQLLDLSPTTAAWLAVSATVLTIIGGALAKLPALTFGAAISLALQVVTAVLESEVGHEVTTRRILIIVVSLLVVGAKFTTAEDQPDSPLATGTSTDIGRERTQSKV